MKLTVNLDEEVLNNVVKITGATTKTEAIMKALREIERKARLVEVLREGLGASEAELKSMFDPSSAPAREKCEHGSDTSASVSMVAE